MLVVCVAMNEVKCSHPEASDDGGSGSTPAMGHQGTFTASSPTSAAGSPTFKSPRSFADPMLAGLTEARFAPARTTRLARVAKGLQAAFRWQNVVDHAAQLHPDSHDLLQRIYVTLASPETFKEQ